MNDPRAFLLQLFQTAVAAASDFSGIADHIPEVTGRLHVIGAGKAAAAMALALERGLPERGRVERLSGFVVVPDGHDLPLADLEVLCASHPTPDARSEVAGRRAMAEAGALGADDLLIALISGGGSSLLAAPSEGVSLTNKTTTTRLLLNAGQPIAVVNAVRARLSAIKGGGLAQAAWPARVVTFVLSDVPGDDPAIVASGPTLGAAMTVPALPDDVMGLLPPPVQAHLAEHSAARSDLNRDVKILATADGALAAAASAAEAIGVHVLNLGGALQGDAVTLAREHAELARFYDGPRPAIILSGGETTVRVVGPGRGGRNTEYLLALAIALEGQPGIFAIAADTDGWDGAGPAAGAILDPTTVERSQRAGYDAILTLAANDSLSLFEALGDAVLTGPTRTNVNDFRAIILL